jgi:hypothetical protein
MALPELPGKADETLLQALHLAVRSDQGVENSQNVASIIQHAREYVPKLWFPFRILVPLGEHCGGHFNVAPELFCGIAPQKQPIEEGRLTLGELQVGEDRLSGQN